MQATDSFLGFQRGEGTGWHRHLSTLETGDFCAVGLFHNAEGVVLVLFGIEAQRVQFLP